MVRSAWNGRSLAGDRVLRRGLQASVFQCRSSVIVPGRIRTWRAAAVPVAAAAVDAVQAGADAAAT